MTVISLEQAKLDRTPHLSGAAACMVCHHSWVAVAPIGTNELECPECHTMKGLFRFPFAPSEAQLVRECVCGNQLFYMTPEGHMCANCGTYQSY